MKAKPILSILKTETLKKLIIIRLIGLSDFEKYALGDSTKNPFGDAWLASSIQTREFAKRLNNEGFVTQVFNTSKQTILFIGFDKKEANKKLAQMAFYEKTFCEGCE